MCGIAELLWLDGRPAGSADEAAILDMSAAGHMPMSDSGSRRWVARNGEAYHFLRGARRDRAHRPLSARILTR